MGKTISITLPLPLVNELQNGADKVGISRSRFVSNLLLKWQDDKKKSIIGTEFNDCDKRDKDGFCNEFDLMCNAPLHEILNCVSYKQKSNLSKESK